MNNSRNNNKPRPLFDDLKVSREYRGCFVLDNNVSQFLVVDGIAVAEYVRVSNDLIDLFLEV